MRKNFFRSFIAAVIVCSFLVVPAYAEAAVVTGNRVNFRTGPGSNYSVITSLEKGTPVTVTDRSNSEWYAVSVAGQLGYISSAYLSISEDSVSTVSAYTPSPSESSGDSTGYINAMYVRFRSGPGSDYSVLGEYNRGKAVTILGSGDGWTACMIDGQLGYVYSNYVASGSASSASTSTSATAAVQTAQVEQTPAVQPTFSLPQPDVTLTPEASATVAPEVTPSAAPASAITPDATVAPVQTEAPAATVAPSSSSTSGMEATINGTYVRFRSGPGTNHSILGTYNTGKVITVTGDAGNGWYQCIIDGMTGYVYSNYVLFYDLASYSVGSQADTQPAAETTAQPAQTQAPAATAAPEASYTDGYITGNNVRFRSAPSMTAAILGELFYGNQVTLCATQDGWSQVIYNGQVGYVSAKYVSEGSSGLTIGGTETTTGTDSDTSAATESSAASAATTTTAAVTSGSATGQDVANFACQFVGYNYAWGGKSPETGFDCSGLVYYVYQQFGYTLNRVAADQATNGVHVDASNLQPGDILCFYSSSSYIGHVGIYIGNGYFVHASNSTTGVIISALSGSYVSRGFEARRIIT